MREEVLYELFSVLKKAYDELYRERRMEIIVGYGFGPLMERILRNFWDHLSMVSRVKCYYITPFKDHWGFTQGVLYTPPYLIQWFTR